MNTSGKGVLITALAVCLLAFAGISYGYVVDFARVTIECGNHAVSVNYVGFTLDGIPVHQDFAPGIGCAMSAGDSKVYPFMPALDINDFEFDYVCDDGQVTHVVIPSGEFYFHMPLELMCPSPGGTITLNPSAPVEGGAYLLVSDHDALEWPSSECFKFRGTTYDYVCVTWYCESNFDPVFSITPGCADPCADPTCTPAVYQGIGYSAICNPVPNIYCRTFWPIGLTQPGCWCYFFEYQLPVELALFTAQPDGDAIRIHFATASEQNNGRFEIWRGTEQYGEFTEIARLTSLGDAASQQDYDYRDADITPGVTYWYYLADVDLQGHRVEHRDRIQSATAQTNLLPSDYTMSAYPNPFNPATTIAFTLPMDSRVTLRVYDMNGRMVDELANASFTAGQHKVAFDASALPSGIYLARMETPGFVSTQKLLLIK